MRPIQFCLTDQWTQHSGQPLSLVTTSNEARQALLWWTTPAHLLREIPLTLSDVDLHPFFGRFHGGLGGAATVAPGRGFVVTDPIGPPHQQLEPLAVDLAPKQFLPTVRHSGAMQSTCCYWHDIPGRLYVLADRLSRRRQVIQTDWFLAPSVAARIWKLWGTSHVVACLVEYGQE